MTLVFVALGFMGFIAATMLAIDVGMVMTARSQAQNSADAGALAGAVALAFEDYADRSPNGPAVQGAINAAQINQVMYGQVSVTPGDVVFENDPAGEPNRVTVSVRRTAERGNPVSTIIAGLFGINTADIGATATAEVSPADAMTCAKPFTVPDRWVEKQTPPWDPDDTFDIYDKKGDLLPPETRDVYVPRGPGYSGYSYYAAPSIVGLRVVLKTSNDSKVTPGIYNPILLPGSGRGADDYRWNIANCNSGMFKLDDILIPEPGNMVGPTQQGIDDLIAKDPNAKWDPVDEKVISYYHPSPRVISIPVYDPYFYEVGKQEGRYADFRVANFLGFFIEGMQGNEVVGYITPIGGLRAGGGGPVPEGSFPKVIRLIR